MVSFKILGEIQTKQRPRANIRGGFAHIYTPKETIHYENYVKSEYQRQRKNWFGDSPLCVKIRFEFKAPKDIEKYVKLGYNIACVNCKDLDNLAKIVLDALNGVAYEDDKQIISLEVSKHYGEIEQVIVDIDYCKDKQMLADVKKEEKERKLLERFKELEKKSKLTKAEKERLQELRGYFGI